MTKLDNTYYRINEICKHAALAKTGPPRELCKKIPCSEHTLYNDIKIINELLQPFHITLFYNYLERTYQFSKPGHFQLNWIWIPES